MQLPGSLGGLGDVSELRERCRPRPSARVTALAAAGWTAPVIAARAGMAITDVRAVLDCDAGAVR